MTARRQLGHTLKRILFQAARLPAIYLIIGIFLLSFADIDDIFALTQWKNWFDLADQLGEVFVALALLTFLYMVVVLFCRKKESTLADSHKIATLIFGIVRKGLRIIFILAIINTIISIIGPTKFYLVLANNIINIIIIGSVGWIALQILNTIESALYHQMMKLTKAEHMRVKALYTKMHILRNIATVVIVILTIAAILMSFSSVRNIGISLLASAGFLTAIVGLAAQKALFSLFSGLQIALSHPIKIGDIVAIDNVSGMIEEITFTYVTLKLCDRRRLIVPIHYFIDKPFENWSRDGESLRMSFHLYVDYLTPIEPIRSELNRILSHSPLWDGSAYKLEVADITERAVQLRIQISAANADDIGDLRAEVREKLLAFIRDHYPEHFPTMRFNRLPEGTNLHHVELK